jgi:hypothetical protein
VFIQRINTAPSELMRRAEQPLRFCMGTTHNGPLLSAVGSTFHLLVRCATDKVYPKAGGSHRKGLVVSGFVETGTIFPPPPPHPIFVGRLTSSNTTDGGWVVLRRHLVEGKQTLHLARGCHVRLPILGLLHALQPPVCFSLSLRLASQSQCITDQHDMTRSFFREIGSAYPGQWVSILLRSDDPAMTSLKAVRRGMVAVKAKTSASLQPRFTTPLA